MSHATGTDQAQLTSSMIAGARRRLRCAASTFSRVTSCSLMCDNPGHRPPAVFRDQRRVAVAQQARIGLELRALAAAQQSVQRLAGALAEDVPQRDLDAGEGIDERPVAAQQVHRMQDVAGKRLDVPASRPITSGATIVSSAALVVGDGGMAERLAPADQAVLRLDPHQQDLEMRPGLAGEKLGSGHPCCTARQRRTI